MKKDPHITQRGQVGIKTIVNNPDAPGFDVELTHAKKGNRVMLRGKKQSSSCPETVQFVRPLISKASAHFWSAVEEKYGDGFSNMRTVSRTQP